MQNIESRESRRQVVIHWVLALILFPVLGALNYVTTVLHGWAQTPWWALLLLAIFDLMGVWALWNLIRQTLDWARIGAIPLTLRKPAQAGETLVSQLALPAALGEAHTLDAEFVCQHKRWEETNDGESSNQIITVLHAEQQTISLPANAQANSVEVRFAVPETLPYPDTLPAEQDENAEDDPERGFSFWELRIVIHAPHGDVRRTYPIAVRRS